jgi:hypothetical protein
LFQARQVGNRYRLLHRKVGFNLIKEEINQSGNEMCRWEKNI